MESASPVVNLFFIQNKTSVVSPCPRGRFLAGFHWIHSVRMVAWLMTPLFTPEDDANCVSWLEKKVVQHLFALVSLLRRWAWGWWGTGYCDGCILVRLGTCMCHSSSASKAWTEVSSDRSSEHVISYTPRDAPLSFSSGNKGSPGERYWIGEEDWRGK